jgi:hypothetical protein
MVIRDKRGDELEQTLKDRSKLIGLCQVSVTLHKTLTLKLGASPSTQLEEAPRPRVHHVGPMTSADS